MSAKRRNWLPVLVTSSLLCTVCAASAATPGGCSLATLKGAYGSVEDGTIVVDFFGFPVPYRGLVAGLATYDGAGHFAVTYTASFGGFLVLPGTTEGTYVVNADCTYSDETPATSAHREGTVTGDGMSQEIHTIFTDFWVVGHGTRKKTPVGQCSLATLRGEWAAFEEGAIVSDPASPVPFDLVSNTTFDGAGNMSGDFTANVGGVETKGTFTGTYNVTPDCAYSDEFTPVSTVLNGPFHHTGFIAGQGIFQEGQYIYSDLGVAISGMAKKK